MDVILKRSGDDIALFVDKQVATIFENKTIDQVTDWIAKNLKGVTVHIKKYGGVLHE